MIEPAIHILNFAGRQSDLVKPKIHFAIAAALEPAVFRDPRLAELAAIQVLTEGLEIACFYRCVSVVGALDFFFSHPALTAPDILEAIPIEKLEGAPALQLMAMQSPLARRQLESARTDWAKLRQGVLSFEALRALQATSAEAWTRTLLGP